jgi:hypothetical protein
MTNRTDAALVMEVHLAIGIRRPLSFAVLGLHQRRMQRLESGGRLVHVLDIGQPHPHPPHELEGRLRQFANASHHVFEDCRVEISPYPEGIVGAEDGRCFCT